MSSILTSFNTQFMAFVDFVCETFPSNVDILTAKNSLILLKKANPRLLIKIWKTYIVDKYRTYILAGDISFFLTKDYSTDVSKLNDSDNVIRIIDNLRKPIEQMNEVEKAKTMNYIKLLSILSDKFV